MYKVIQLRHKCSLTAHFNLRPQTTNYNNCTKYCLFIFHLHTG